MADKSRYPFSLKRLLVAGLDFLRDRFNLETDNADELETIERIRRDVEFRGTNLWILIFAVFIASIGLNVNSTAVIIGAMLISPLMGPILGIGTGVAINDLELLKKAFKNLMIATLFSVATSTLYFLVSPLSDAQSELLARTNPTIWDVLIALFGGLTGIVAVSRKEKSNALPGVAIATALMPPLCTAGYGLATGNLYYFIGAFYLYFINGVFISLSTFLIIRFLKYPKKEFVDPAREKRVRGWITFFVSITIVPSLYLAYQTVERSVFERNASRFITTELNYERARVISKQINFNTVKPTIEVTILGEKVDDKILALARSKMDQYKLRNTELIVFQDYRENVEPAQLSTTILHELMKQNETSLKTKEEQIQSLTKEVAKLKGNTLLIPQVATEARALYPTLIEFSIDQTVVMELSTMKPDTTHIAYLKFSRKPSAGELRKIEEWLKARVNIGKIKIVQL
ncbi:MAG: TIGR00341 family protein [Cyclobacteriaceae bacterium]|nr:TIGR00341 family protein [Cyclobacteriaceae bacterium]